MNTKRSSSFYRNVVYLMSGTALAQTLPFIALPFLQKYFYSPTEFALFFAFTRFADMFMTIGSLKLELGLVMQKAQEKQAALIKIIYNVIIGFSIIVFVLMVIFRHQIAAGYDQPELASYFLFVPLLMVGYGLYQTYYYWMNSKGMFKQMALSKVVQTSASEGLKLITGFLNFSAIGLILGRFIGVFSTMIYSVFLYRRGKENVEVSKTERKNQWQLNKDFAYFSAPTVLVKTLINFLVIDMIFKTYGPNQAGNFGASMMYLGAFLGMMSASFGQVYYNRISEITNRDELMKTYMSWMKKLSMISAGILILVWAFPSSWVQYILGDEWILLMPIAKIMSVWMGVQFISGSISFIYVRLGKQKVMLGLDVIQLFLAIGGLYLGNYIFETLNGTLWLYTIGQSLFYLLAIFAAIYFIKVSKLKPE